MKETIKKLVEAFGPSGYEDEVRAIIQAEIAGLVDEMRVDALGNLIAWKRESGGKKIMLSAHMDEIGVIASYIDEKGFVRVNPIGGVRTLYEVTGRVRFANGTVGVLGVEKMDDPNKVPSFDKLFVDVGATGRHDCPVKIGDMACFWQPMVEVGERIIAKAMDDRIACAVMIEALRQLKGSPHELFFVFSTQEEVGLRGVTTGAYGIAPDLGLAIDVTFAGDTPEPAVKMAIELGKGPAIKVKDSGMLATPWVKNWMIATAEKHGIPYQLEVLTGGTTDARAIQTTREGVPAGCLSIPTRYVHSPSEMVSYADVQNAVKLLVALLENPI